MDNPLDNFAVDFEEISYGDEIYYDQNWPDLTTGDTFEPATSTKDKQEEQPLVFPAEPSETAAPAKAENSKPKKRQKETPMGL